MRQTHGRGKLIGAMVALATVLLLCTYAMQAGSKAVASARESASVVATAQESGAAALATE